MTGQRGGYVDAVEAMANTVYEEGAAEWGFDSLSGEYCKGEAMSLFLAICGSILFLDRVGKFLEKAEATDWFTCRDRRADGWKVR